jgi:hypothetical protein
LPCPWVASGYVLRAGGPTWPGSMLSFVTIKTSKSISQTVVHVSVEDSAATAAPASSGLSDGPVRRAEEPYIHLKTSWQLAGERQDDR